MVSMSNHLPKGGAAVQSRITQSKAGIGTLAPDGFTPLITPLYSPLKLRGDEGGLREIFKRVCLFNCIMNSLLFFTFFLEAG